ncbi:hypothetical protein DO97_16080 [Neosynechococcus sphagnicola sy1]|uniref:WbqC-like protein n=1 Tax=Neosynechococcus sphagnicola sy1 TaxID=1497020 RepID=A0A098TGI9_9CYAN|nr:WbqC family protein [Neosynechococcus sphagnicola]KGF71695.1 hypothetical protein DO97_16080 [Neosynechococcus sphagnicola sy1]
MSNNSGRRVGVIQSSYIPWRGYFDLIDSVDVFVIYDDVQYSKGSWRNRNQVKLPSGLRWLTVPVRYKSGLAIDQVPIDASRKAWQESHRGLLREALGTTPFFSEAITLWEAGVAAADTTISQLNVRLIQVICRYLNINTPLIRSRDLNLSGHRCDRLMQLLNHVGATTYLSGPSARDYLDESLFRQAQIRLEYKTYDYPPYPQPWGDFVGTVSVLDLIANTGPEARYYLKSQTSDTIAVP